MSNKTIAKFLTFVILTSFLSLLGAACATVNTGSVPSSDSYRYGVPEIIGKIKSPEVVESSGIAASRCQGDVFWTHNDSGGRPVLYAFNRSGDSLGAWQLQDVENRDWEDIATWKDKKGRCFVYIGEIGDNKRIWPEHAIFRVSEPLVTRGESSSISGDASATLPVESIRYVYPDGVHDAEALMVQPQSGDIFVVTKNDSGPASIYRIIGEFGSSQRQSATKIAEISLPSVPNGLVTGGDISPDGRSLILCDYRQAYELDLPELAANFDEIWKQKPHSLDIGKRKTGEAICYSIDGTEILATSEGRNPPIISVLKLK